MRKLLILAALGVLGAVALLYTFVHTFFVKDTKQTQKSPTAPAVRAGERGGAVAPVVVPKLIGSPIPPNNHIAGLTVPETQPQSFVQVETGGAWVDGKLIAVDLFGDPVPVRNLPYAYTVDKKNRKVLITVPDSVLASLRPGLWVDSSRVLSRPDQKNPSPTSKQTLPEGTKMLVEGKSS